jgi:hypothetical protein
LEWNGSITITEFRKRVDEIITVIVEKENKWETMQIIALQ